MSTVAGLDVSYWQPEIDWERVRAAGARFTFIKATEGVAYTDPTFTRNWEAAGSAGLLRGAYCFFHPNQDARQQAERFIRILRERADSPELPCSIDLEVTDGVPNHRIVAGAKIWLEAVSQSLGRRPMIYSGISFLETRFTEGGVRPAWTQEYDLWLGWFPKKFTAGMSPLMPRGWSQWAFWQYSGSGRIPGISSPVDLDLFNGTDEDLATLATGDAAPEIMKTHIVSAGETAETIAAEYSISTAALMGANMQLVRPGQRLFIPGPSSTPGGAVRTHTVIRGETLDAIARRYGTTIPVLVALNKIPNPNVIEVGQILLVG